jgi:hypothetical protein
VLSPPNTCPKRVGQPTEKGAEHIVERATKRNRTTPVQAPPVSARPITVRQHILPLLPHLSHPPSSLGTGAPCPATCQPLRLSGTTPAQSRLFPPLTCLGWGFFKNHFKIIFHPFPFIHVCKPTYSPHPHAQSRLFPTPHAHNPAIYSHIRSSHEGCSRKKEKS